MKRGNAYSALGGHFEYFNDCDYEKWSQYLYRALQEFGIASPASGADFGCGGGYFTRALTRYGFSVIGVDPSAEMLSEAKRSGDETGVFAQYCQGDVSSFRAPHRLDFAVAVNDVFNYVSPARLVGALKNVANNLKKGGVFAFDFSTEYKLKNTIGNQTFGCDDEECSYLWFNTLYDDRVEMDLSVFTRRNDGAYDRADETQIQYIHTKESVCDALGQAGFELVEESEIGQPLTATSQRICLVCKKN